MSRQIHVGKVAIGGGAPVSIQSMTNTPTHDVEATLKQIRELVTAGCEIVRVAVPDERAARAIGVLKAGSPVPLVADIHFDYRLALISVEQGIDKIRINPGNIGGADRVEAVAKACKERGIPFELASTAALWKRNFWKNTVVLPLRLWWKVPWVTLGCWSGSGLKIFAYL